jgi:hypothetical protein
MKPHRWKRSSFRPLRVAGKRDKAERVVVLRGKGAGTTISKAEMYRRVYGAHPAHLAAERKAGARTYKSAAAEAQAKHQITKRAKNREQLGKPPYNRAPTHDIVYINTDDVVAHDYFWKEYLRRIHEYRDAVAHAKFEGDGRGLQKFKNMIFMTYDGPGLPGYDNKGVRVYPQTSLRKILKVEAAMTGQQKAQYEADVNYRYLRSAA